MSEESGLFEQLEGFPSDPTVAELRELNGKLSAHRKELCELYNRTNEDGQRGLMLGMAVGMCPVPDERVLIVLVELLKAAGRPDQLESCCLERINLANTGYKKEFTSVGEFSMSLAGALIDSLSWIRDPMVAIRLCSVFQMYLESLFYRAMCKGVSAMECLEMAVKMHLDNEELEGLPDRFAPQHRSRSRSRSASPKRKV